MNRRPPKSTLFPYPTLSRSLEGRPLLGEHELRDRHRLFQPLHALCDRRELDAISATLRFVPCGADAEHRARSEEHTSELQSQSNLVCRLLLAKKKHIDSPAI